MSDLAPVDENETALTTRRYDRIAPFYDFVETGMELRAKSWRRDLWSLVEGKRILEVGVGTGKNIPFHPVDRETVALDISSRMLARATRVADRLQAGVRLQLGDVQRLPFEDARFDTVVGTFLFCSVPDPVLGLSEIRRVLAPGGHLLLLEHVLSERRLLRPLMRWLDPVPVRIWGAHIARETVTNVGLAGFVEIEATDLSLDIVKRITARAP